MLNRLNLFINSINLNWSYKIFHENRHDHPDHVRFTNDLVSAVDPKIDFTGANVVIVVVPPGTPLNLFEQGTLKDFNTKEGRVKVGSTQYPFTLNGFDTVKFSSFLSPFWYLHSYKFTLKFNYQ